MAEDAAVRNQGPSTTESTNEGKMHNDNCMPARSINMYDDFTGNSYIFILYGRGCRSEEPGAQYYGKY